MGASDLQISVAAQRLRCVLEPALVLSSPFGARLAHGLTRVFEVWLTRSFWRAIDASELLSLSTRDALPLERTPDAKALADWAGMRDSKDAGSWLMRWVGDCVADSQLHAGHDPDLVDRFEWFAAGLDTTGDGDALDPLPWWQQLDLRAGAVDAVALSAALDGALILCAMPPDGTPPWPVQIVERCADSSVERITADERGSLFATERQLVRQAVAQAGMTVLMQQLAPAAVVHVLADPSRAATGDDGVNPWSTTRTWWYAL